MSAVESPLMKQLATHMRYMTQRQTVLAANIANIDTPGYVSKDLKPLDFGKMAESENHKLTMVTTSPKHISSRSAVSFALNDEKDPGEITPMKNTVSLDEEMAKISDTGSEFQMSSAMFKKFTGMYRAAIGNR